jgi:hypothetical protein
VGAARTGCVRQGKCDMGGRLGWRGGAGRLLEYGWAGRVSRRPAPERRLSWSGIRWQIGRLEAVDRDSVSLGWTMGNLSGVLYLGSPTL